jgi:hypothetical protein
LREIEKFRSEERKVFYLDETWINEGHTKTKIWVDESIKSARQAFIEGFSTGVKDPCEYHCELNPIELIWAQIKNEVASKNITFKLRDVKPLFQEAVEHVTDENWKKCIEHSKKIENEMRRIGENFGTVPELIISLQDSSSDTSTESDSDKENFD